MYLSLLRVGTMRLSMLPVLVMRLLSIALTLCWVALIVAAILLLLSMLRAIIAVLRLLLTSMASMAAVVVVIRHVQILGIEKM